MTDTEQTPERKPTPTERVWEAFNAVLLKPPHRGSESTSYSTVTVGDMKGRTVVKHDVVRGEEETWDEFRARCQRQWADLNADATAYDAGRMQRELEASMEATK